MGKDLKGNEIGKGIMQRPDGRYMGRYTDRYKKRTCIYDRNLSRLKKRLDTEKRRVASPSLSDSGNKVILDQWFDVWMNVFKKDIIRPTTKTGYTRIYDQFISPVYGKRSLQSIKFSDIQRLVNDLANRGYKYATTNRVRVLLVDMFDKATIDDLVWKNPARGVRVPKDPDFERRVLTRDEQLTFLETASGTYYYNLYIVALNTGMRIGEVAALTPKDIDFKKKLITVSKTLTYQKLDGDEKKGFHIGPPKTDKSNRTIPISRECEIALKKQFMQNNIIKSKLSAKMIPGLENLLFVTSLNGPINSQIISDDIKRILYQINMMRDESDRFEYFSFHSFRHTFATRCFEAGMDAKVVQHILGHATLQMTLDLYTHLTEDKRSQEFVKFENDIDQLMASKESVDEQIYRDFIESEYKELNKVVKIQFG